MSHYYHVGWAEISSKAGAAQSVNVLQLALGVFYLKPHGR